MSEQAPLSPENEKRFERYVALMHGCQSAVAFEIESFGDNAAAADHKHLRTGINACLVDSSAMAQLLIRKGVFTEDEYFVALEEAAERELATLTERLREKTGIPNLSFE